jgi:Arc/MetJ family transcription regulator
MGAFNRSCWDNYRAVDIMKTTIEIDATLLKEAQKALGTTTIKGTVDASLKAIVRQRQLQVLAYALGTISSN